MRIIAGNWDVGCEMCEVGMEEGIGSANAIEIAYHA